jgi:hypothetical protein
LNAGYQATRSTHNDNDDESLIKAPNHPSPNHLEDLRITQEKQKVTKKKRIATMRSFMITQLQVRAAEMLGYGHRATLGRGMTLRLTEIPKGKRRQFC